MELYRFKNTRPLVKKVTGKNGKLYRLTFYCIKTFPKVEIKDARKFVRLKEYYRSLSPEPKNIKELQAFEKEMAMKDLGEDLILKYAIAYHRRFFPLPESLNTITS